LLKNDDWKFDPIPEIMDGYNIADFVDPDIEHMLELLEQEEEERERQLEEEYDEDDEVRFVSCRFIALRVDLFH
jgi:nucleolar GTP-binding protein